MPTDYLPSRDTELDGFAQNFSTKLTAGPTDYGVTLEQATAFATLSSDFTTAMRALQDPATKSPFYVAAKNSAREALVDGPGGIRALAALVQAHPGITDQQLIDLRLTVRDRQPTPVPPPVDSPEIDFLPTGTRTIRIRLHNENTLSRKKPEGVKGATIFYHVGESAPVQLSEWKFYENVTKTTLDVNLPADVASGSPVWFTAFWRNAKDQAGPAATPVRTTVQFGGLSQAA